MGTINIDGLDIVVVNGKAKLSARSWQQSNPSMWRYGSAQYEGALRNQAKAERILNSLNTTGSYVNSKGMRTYMNRGSNLLNNGQWSQKADPGTEAAATEAQIAASGGLTAQESVPEQDTGLSELIEAAFTIAEEIREKAQEYLDKVTDVTKNIAQSIANVFVD